MPERTRVVGDPGTTGARRAPSGPALATAGRFSANARVPGLALPTLAPVCAAQARQALLREVRAQSNLLLRRTERCSWFRRPSIGDLARIELQASLRADDGAGTPRRCIVLLACAVDHGAAVPSALVECCREAAERSGDAAVRTLFLVCLRRLAGAGWARDESTLQA